MQHLKLKQSILSNTNAARRNAATANIKLQYQRYKFIYFKFKNSFGIIYHRHMYCLANRSLIFCQIVQCCIQYYIIKQPIILSGYFEMSNKWATENTEITQNNALKLKINRAVKIKNDNLCSIEWSNFIIERAFWNLSINWSLSCFVHLIIQIFWVHAYTICSSSEVLYSKAARKCFAATIINRPTKK